MNKSENHVIAPSTGTREVTNIGLAAYLSSTGYTLKEIKPSTRDRQIFVFDANNGIDEDIMLFFNRKAKCCPLTFWENMKNLKSLVEIR